MKLGIDFNDYIYVSIHDGEKYSYLLGDGLSKIINHEKDFIVDFAMSEMKNALSLYPHKEMILNLDYFCSIKLAQDSFYISLNHPNKPDKAFGVNIDHNSKELLEKVISQLKEKKPEVDLFYYKDYILDIGSIESIVISENNERQRFIEFKKNNVQIPILLDRDEEDLAKQILNHQKRKVIFDEL